MNGMAGVNQEKEIEAKRNFVKKKLLPWFKANQRHMPWREERTPYRVWISELMLQQTRVDQAIPYFNRFMERFPTLEILANASQEEVLKYWEGLGYYARARNLHKAAQILLQEHNQSFPQTVSELQSLPGIGPYTAAAVASLAFNVDCAVVDGNVIRVLTRWFAYAEDARSSASKQQFQRWADSLLVQGQAGDFNEAMMELGATICLPRSPRCPECPMKKSCAAFERKTPEAFPVKPPRKKPPHLVVGAAVVLNEEGHILVAQRRQGEMLGGLWEFPGGKQEKGENIQECIARELKEELDIHIEVGDFLITVHHAYSHFTMELHTYFARIRQGTPRAVECAAFRWMQLEELRQLPYSKADLYIIEALEKMDSKIF
jgi:A/G-specific adenine glycosylase